MRNYPNTYLIQVITLFSSFLFASCNSGITEEMVSKTIAKELLIEDLNYLIEEVEKRHVDLYERANKDSLLLIKNQILNSITEDLNRNQFYKIIARINPYFNDAHCLVFPLREEASFQKEAGFSVFPFHVILDENWILRPERSYKRASDGAFVDKSWSISSINGVKAEDLIDSIANYSHGETETLRSHMTTLLFSDWLFSIFGWSGDFEITFNQDSKSLRIDSDDIWNSLERNVVQFNRLEILDNNVGYLRLGSFDVDEHKNQYEDFIENSFDSLSSLGVKKLVIDVRGNTGGQSGAGELVLKYLTDKKLSQVSQMFDRIHEENAGIFNYRGNPGDLKEVSMGSGELIKPNRPEKQFKGETVVLFDEMTYSAGIIFITIVQDHKIAKTVGRPTGGFANQTGNIESFQLPNSKLTVYVPSRKFVRVNGDKSIHPVVPDFIILNSDSTLTSEDRILEFGINVLNDRSL